MNRIKLASIVLLSLTIVVGFSAAGTRAIAMQSYTPGDEVAIFGHSFAEEKWVNDSIWITDDDTNDTAQLIMSYVNYTGIGSFQAALLALGVVRDWNTNTSTYNNATLPYQLFGMHFTTPGGRDVFTGAIFAFLYGWNDTNENGFPDSSDDRPFFLVPYGYDKGNGTAGGPTVTALPLNGSALTGHYQFGVKYTNMYLRAVSTKNALEFWVTLAIPFIELRVSELTFIYDIHVNTTTGEITAETKYRIGQVQEAYFLGFEIADPQEFMNGLGIGATHFVAIFASNYLVEEGTTQPRPAAEWITTNVTAGGERAFAIGIRGEYDQINEQTGTPIATGLPAYSWLLEPNATDRVLIAWQLGFSAHVFSVFAYAMSPFLQTMYTSPAELRQNAASAFTGGAVWYGIAFSEWAGYRIIHDPVYTAYSNVGQLLEPQEPSIPGFPFEAIIIGVATSLLVVFVVRRRKKH